MTRIEAQRTVVAMPAPRHRGAYERATMSAFEGFATVRFSHGTHRLASVLITESLLISSMINLEMVCVPIVRMQFGHVEVLRSACRRGRMTRGRGSTRQTR